MLIPKLVEQNKARLKISTHHNCKDALVRLNLQVALANNINQIAKPGRVQFLLANAVLCQMTLLYIMVRLAIIHNVANAEAIRIQAHNRAISL